MASKRKRAAPAASLTVISEAAMGAEPDVGRLVDSSQADDRRMIGLVRERPLLYARNNMPVASYYTQVKKLWQEVADEMAWTVADVRRKWSHIRNSYSRHLRNELYGVRTGRGRMVSRWYLADELAFLRDHMATDTRPSRFSFAGLYEPAEPEPLLPTPWLAALAGEPAPDDASSAASFEPDENCAYFQFFRGIHHDYLELPPQLQRQFRRECLAALHRLLDEPAQALNLSQHSDDERDHKACVVIDSAPSH